METTTPSPPARISKVAGRYLIFDLADVMRLRRAPNGMCAVLVGTNPQAPNQNVFSALPLQLLAEEARLLVDRGDARIVDELAAHLDALAAEDTPAGYVDAHSARRDDARATLQSETDAKLLAAREAREAGAFDGKKGKKAKRRAAAEAKNPDGPSGAPPAAAGEASELDLFAAPAAAGANTHTVKDKTAKNNPTATVGKVFITPATSEHLVRAAADAPQPEPAPAACPLYAHLNSRGYFMTPGIRFGGQYSVYPGDPFRFHAHFIANAYAWDQDVDVLELVGVGRLAGAVKKGMLLGAERPGEGEGEPDGRNVRTFCVEWAGM